MRILLAPILLASLIGCSHVPHSPIMPTALLPITAPVGAAVLIENSLEDPACDAQEDSTTICQSLTGEFIIRDIIATV